MNERTLTLGRVRRTRPILGMAVVVGLAAISGCTAPTSEDDVDSASSAAALGTCSVGTIASVRASGNDGNVPANVLDNDLGTRWSVFGKGSWIQADLGSTKSVCSAAVAWYRGDVRRSTFQILLSSDGVTFTRAFSGRSGGTSTALETYAFAPTNARYVRVVVNGNTDNDWASITELRASADSGASTPPPPDGGSPPPPPSGSCNRNATPSTFASELSAATAGHTVCLATGNYGTFSGTSKAVTIKAASGASASMKFSFGAGDTGFTIDGMVNAGGSIGSGASNITIRNSAFDSEIRVDGTTPSSNIVFDGNTHNNISGYSTSQRFLANGAVTIKNSRFEGGGSDGVRLGSSQPVQVINNTFLNILADGSGNHTDMIQAYGGSNAIVRGNFFKQTISGDTQVFGAYDGTSGNLIEDNVIDVTSRNWGIELYSDKDSIVRHNTVAYHDICSWNQPCGLIALDRKSVNPAGSGTQVYDNIAIVVISNGSTASRNDHNLSGQSVKYVGGLSPTTYAGYTLAAGSPGVNAASDGLDLGARLR